jgi:hypothetical protein
LHKKTKSLKVFIRSLEMYIELSFSLYVGEGTPPPSFMLTITPYLPRILHMK